MPDQRDDRISFVRRLPEPVVISFPARPDPVEVDLARSALLIVDMQNDFLHENGWFPQSGVDPAPLCAIIPTINALTAAVRDAGMPVAWVNWGVRPDRANLPGGFVTRATDRGRRPTYADPSPSGKGSILVRNDWGAATVDELTVADTDITVHKHRLSGFWDNELDSVLRLRDITTLFFAGINTDRCVFATLTDASFLGYDCILVEDACATPAPPHVETAILDLVRSLYGVTAASGDIVAAFGYASPPPRVPPVLNSNV